MQMMGRESGRVGMGTPSLNNRVKVDDEIVKVDDERGGWVRRTCYSKEINS